MLFVVVTEISSEERLHAEHVEEAGGDDAGLDALRFGTAEQDEPHVVELDHAGERARLPAVVVHLFRREAEAVGAVVLAAGLVARPLLPQDDQLVAALVGQRLEEHAVDDAEDRGVGADAERHRQDDDEREAWRLEERACPVAHVLHERLGGAHEPRVADVIFHTADVAERGDRRAARLIARHAGADVLVGLHVEVEAHFGVERALELGSTTTTAVERIMSFSLCSRGPTRSR